MFPNRLADDPQYAVGFLQHVVIPEAQHAVAQGFQFCCAFGICSLLPAMLATVQFDDQLLSRRTEIDDVGANRMLSSELDAFQPSPP